MNKAFYLIVAIAIFATGCMDNTFKKTKKSGLEYKIIRGNDNTEVKYGNAIKFTLQSFYKDSVLSTPYDSVPQILQIDSLRLPPDYITIFSTARKSDSIITRILVDSAMKSGPVPPFAKKGQYLGFRVKILDVFTDSAKIISVQKEAMQQLVKVDSLLMAQQKTKDDKILADKIAAEHVNAVKTAKGTYVEIKNPGQGIAIDSGKAVTVNYKGMTLDGKIFDQSYDSSGKPTKPFTFLVGQRGAIEGMDDGIRMFKKGGTGRLFIPSGLGYGMRGAGGDIKPNEPLIFEIQVVDVNNGDDYRMKMEAQNRMLRQMQQMQQQREQQQQGQQNK
jgi:FKBP-type peptidyl-prolyl cis-trans isomerase